MNKLKTRLIKIGNSRGIRIPKAIIDLIGLDDEVEIVVQDDQLVIRRSSHPREGWEEQIIAADLAEARRRLKNPQ